MEHKFIGRELELNTLNRQYQSNKFELSIIYGRRRVGKSRLIREFIKDKSDYSIAFQAVETKENINLLFLSQIIDEYTNNITESNRPAYPDYRKAFLDINNIALSSKEKLIFIIDEFPYLVESDSSISSILQDIIDNYYKKHDKLMLILCGSSMSFMENQVLGHKSPLYGRRTSQFKIKPFSIFETNTYLNIDDKNDLLAYYGITGGIPTYLEYIDTNLSLKENITNMFLYPGAPLLEEPESLLKQELKNPMLYNSILYSIANGASKNSEIASATGISPTNLLTNLKNLIDMGIIEKKLSFDDKKGTKPVYIICDGLYRFWYTYIQANLSRIHMGNISYTIDYIIHTLPRFLGYTFEQVSYQYTWKYLDDFGISNISTWWGNDPINKTQAELDLVAVNMTTKQAILGECKYRKSEQLNVDMIDTLIHRSSLVPNILNKELYFFLKESNKHFENHAQSKNIKIVLYDDFFK